MQSATIAPAPNSASICSQADGWAVIGLAAFFTVLLFDYSKISKYGIYIYALNLLLLVAVLVFGEETKGAQAWIPIGSFKLQPAEMVKALLILGLAQFLSPPGRETKYLQRYAAGVYIM